MLSDEKVKSCNDVIDSIIVKPGSASKAVERRVGAGRVQLCSLPTIEEDNIDDESQTIDT